VSLQQLRGSALCAFTIHRGSSHGCLLEGPFRQAVRAGPRHVAAVVAVSLQQLRGSALYAFAIHRGSSNGCLLEGTFVRRCAQDRAMSLQ
jgi:hypothetical protein